MFGHPKMVIDGQAHCDRILRGHVPTYVQSAAREQHLAFQVPGLGTIDSFDSLTDDVKKPSHSGGGGGFVDVRGSTCYLRLLIRQASPSRLARPLQRGGAGIWRRCLLAFGHGSKWHTVSGPPRRCTIPRLPAQLLPCTDGRGKLIAPRACAVI